MSAMIIFRQPTMVILCMLTEGSIRHFSDLEYLGLSMSVSIKLNAGWTNNENLGQHN